jgi:hypothetical protein
MYIYASLIMLDFERMWLRGYFSSHKQVYNCEESGLRC